MPVPTTCRSGMSNANGPPKRQGLSGVPRNCDDPHGFNIWIAAAESCETGGGEATQAAATTP